MPNFKVLAAIVTAAGVRQGQPDSQIHSHKQTTAQ